jgi:hypothetical protein
MKYLISISVLCLLIIFSSTYVFCQTPKEIIFQTEGASFSPLIQLKGDATVLWTFADGGTSTSLNPSKVYGSSGTRQNRLLVSNWNRVKMINIGYDAGDGGSYGIPFIADQHVSKVTNLDLVKDSLEIWCSSYNQLDTLIFDNFISLDSIECFLSSSVRHVSLKNTPNLTRLCLEDNNLSTLDISECTSLRDLRGASNNYPTINFSNSTEEIWHICIRDNTQITNDSMFSHMERFPSISELFIWNDNQKGTFKLMPQNNSPSMQLLAEGNHYTKLDLKGTLTNKNYWCTVNFNSNNLKSVDIEGCGQIRELNLINNGLSSDTIDKILYQLDQSGTFNRSADLRRNYPPTATGAIYRASLIAKGWIVRTEAASEIDVFGNGQPIIAGDLTPSTIDSTDFGVIHVGKGGITIRFIITNSGSDPLVLEGSAPYVTIFGTDASNFEVVKGPASSIPAGESDTLFIHFDATLNGIFTANISIISNDWNETPFNFAIKGTALVENPDTIIDFSHITDEIVFQTESDSFCPRISINQPATILWTFADGTTSNSLIPVKSYPRDASRGNRLKVTPWSALRTINIGYNGGDGGSWEIPHVDDQHVSKVRNLQLVKDSLRLWCSSYNQIDTLIFDDFVVLDTIECFLSQEQRHVSLKNTPSLQRLCLEDNNLSELDISECSGLMDLRGAVNNYPSISFSNSTEEVWHICIRDNPQLTNDSLFAHMERFPNIAELFIWNDNQRGTFRMSSNHPTRDISLQGYYNHFSRLDLRGSLQNEAGNAEVIFGLNSELKSVDIEGCDQIKRLILPGNSMAADTVDKILRQVDEFGTYNGTVELVGNYPPTPVGITYMNNLIGRGWTVTVDNRPEIDVAGNGLMISRGDDSPSSSDSTDLGEVFIGDTLTVRYIVFNNGCLDLEGSPAQLGGDGASNFKITDNINFPIPAWSSDTLIISYIPTTKSISSAEVYISNNDGDENPFNFWIKGLGVYNNGDLISDYDTVTSEILFLSEGASFNPLIQLNKEATVLWTFYDGTTSTSLNPNKYYGSDSSRMNRLKVTPWSAVSMINIGYNAGDGGSYDIPFVDDQHVSYVKNVHLAHDSLRYWCSSFNYLDSLNFDNFTNMVDIECYLSGTMSKISLKNLPKLKRLCLEDNNLSAYDISECTALEDIRGAVNNYTTINFSNSTEEFWHICVRDNPQITNDSLFAYMERFPEIAELFIWSTSQKGKFRMSENSHTRGVCILADNNRYTSIDLRGALQDSTRYGEISFNGNSTQSVELTGCIQLRRIALGWNWMSSDTINKILREVDEFGTYNGTLDLVGNQMATSEGLIHAQNLESRGWTVYLPGPRIEVWSNNIEILNNDLTPSSPDNTDFGSSNIGESVTHNFTIRNPGQFPLHLSGTPRIVFSGTNPSNFSLSAQPTTPIDAWGSTSAFSITFSPKGTGLRQAIATIVNDGVDGKNPYTFMVQGTGNTQISDTTFASGSVSCFGSETILTIAGDGKEVHVNSGASVSFIASQSIVFLPGFHAYSGCYTHASITTDGTFCDKKSSASPIVKSEEEIVDQKAIVNDFIEKDVKVYPNPNRGRFTVQFENIQFPVEVFVLNSNGLIMYKTTLTEGNSASFNLSQLMKGLYFVTINNGKFRITKKIIVY